VVFSEVGGAPARDGVADILRRADDCRENDEEQNGVAVVQSVDEVVVVAKVDLGDTGRGADDAVHGSPGTCSPSSTAPTSPPLQFLTLHGLQVLFFLVRSMPAQQQSGNDVIHAAQRWSLPIANTVDLRCSVDDDVRSIAKT